MSDHPVHQDDITALNAEGDLGDYMRSLIRPTREAKPVPKRRDRRRWGAIPIPADHTPGAWPPGTSPPGPSPEHDRPAADWDDAVNRYRTEHRAQLDQEDQ